MAFGNASIPTRKYVYGARENVPGRYDDDDRPVRFPGHDTAVEQLRAAAALQNKIVELELARRAEANRIVHAAFPDLAQLLATAEALDAEVEALRADLQQRKAAARTRNPDPAFAAHVRERGAARRAAWAAHKARKDAAYADPAVRAALDANDGAADAAKADARSNAVVGIPAEPATADRPARPSLAPLYWATSLVVMQRVKKSGPPPRFKRFTGEGLIAVQFQRKPDKGSDRVPVFDRNGQPKIHPRSGKPTMRYEAGSSLRAEHIEQSNTLCWVERQKGHKKFATVHFRVGSADDGSPLWAALPFVMHRPVPAGCEIKWAYLSRRQIGVRYRWEVHFDCAMTGAKWRLYDAARDARRHPERSPIGTGRATSGTVAVALGWRFIAGAIRVAVWKGSDGREGEIVIPAERVGRWGQCDALRSQRDTNFEADKEFLMRWLQTRVLPPEWKDRTRNLPQWRSAGRLAALVAWWRYHRLDGDGAVFARMEGEIVPAVRDGRPTGLDRYTGGRRQDRHLHDWSENRRAKCRAWRKHYYQNAALELAARYNRVVVAEIDWHAIAENPLPEEVDDPQVNKRYRGMAACASLRDALTGCMTEARVPAPGITVLCHRCGAQCEPPGRGRWVRCERCGGDPMDRAVNAANNLLNRALGTPEATTPARGL